MWILLISIIKWWCIRPWTYVEPLKKLDNYKLYKEENAPAIRKANNNLVILYNENNEITGVSPLKKDLDDIKTYIYERDIARNIVKKEKLSFEEWLKTNKLDKEYKELNFVNNKEDSANSFRKMYEEYLKEDSRNNNINTKNRINKYPTR